MFDKRIIAKKQKKCKGTYKTKEPKTKPYQKSRLKLEIEFKK